LPYPRFFHHVACWDAGKGVQSTMFQERARLGCSIASAGLEQNDDYSGGYVTDGEPNG
jgi:hypothetical protein